MQSKAYQMGRQDAQEFVDGADYADLQAVKNELNYACWAIGGYTVVNSESVKTLDWWHGYADRLDECVDAYENDDLAWLS